MEHKANRRNNPQNNTNTSGDQRPSNYEIMKYQVQQRFVDYDHSAMIQKFDLKSDEDYLYITFISRNYRIHRVTGEVTWHDHHQSAAWHPAGFNEVLTIFDVLCDSRPDCHLSGEFINMHRLSSLQNGNTGTLGVSLFGDRASFFDARGEALDKACRALGGTPYFKGDIAYVIPLFPFLPVVFQFWHSDDEFPASTELFADSNMLQYMKFETVWFAMGHLLQRICDEM